MVWTKQICQKVLRLFKTDEAVAAVEFALIVPAMLVLYMGSIEVSQVISVDRKMSAATGALGDLVAQSEAQLSTSILDDYFTAVGLIMTPYSANNLKQLVTLVFIDDQGDASVVWSVGNNGATAKDVDSSYIVPSQITAVSLETYLVVSEAQLPYQPWGGYVLPGSFNLYKQFFYMPRFGGQIQLI